MNQKRATSILLAIFFVKSFAIWFGMSTPLQEEHSILFTPQYKHFQT